MKGNEKIIAALNERLAEELGATVQYMLHAEMCADWGYGKLHEVLEKRGITEMRHWEKLVERILFLEGKPVVTKLGPVKIGEDIVKIHRSDLQAEHDAVKAYNETIQLAAKLGDNATKVLLEGILKDEEDHVDWIETQLGLIEQLGLENYLTEQAG
ncbi:MAG: Bacterioferritin [Candidatus Bipolaricaulis sibiricus]|uniref:Bacterioferritin n=1 Tax=Bipolaricaulis sibiricus TaxID=2501609 RepID=A0A410FSG6_BIPS1|nr:MAG: Bacterioferritin [Candidatus Bipolaricaulis sibiricus]